MTFDKIPTDMIICVRAQTDYQQQIIRWILSSKGISTKVWLGGRRENLYGKSFVWRWASGKHQPFIVIRQSILCGLYNSLLQ